MKWLALDIGGANLKAADGEKFAVTQPFPLWEKPQHLAEALRALIALVPKVDHLAATMTGELADCFSSKADGVDFILHALSTAADKRHTRVYMTNGMLVAPQIALKQPLLAAASNWHALAKYAARYVGKGTGLLFDIGSTTCDIIPLMGGNPVSIGNTDPNRLLNGELVYTGVERSPLCAVVSTVPWKGRQCPVAHEVFATTQDIYLILGDLPEELQNHNTADRRPAVKLAARDRLARMICADREVYSEADARAAAEAAAKKHIERVAISLGHVVGRLPEPPETVVISGRGEFLARRVLEHLQLKPKIVSLSSELGPELSRCAAAHALAVLAREGLK
jgi:hypothetical protein